MTKNARKNLELTVEVEIFVGYTETPHNYHVYFPDSRMTMGRRDIKLNEVKAMKLLQIGRASCRERVSLPV